MQTILKSFLHRQSVRFVLMIAAFTACSIISMQVFERMLLSQVQAVTEAANVAFTRLFVNEAWHELRPMLDIEGKTHPRDNRSLNDADMRVRRFAKGTDLIKVKIYNLQGLTVYSSDPTQLGEDKANNKGFQTAAKGRVVSETNYRGKFGAFDGDLYERNLVSSYVPVRGLQGVEAVVEVYADRTASIEGVEVQTRTAWAYFVPGMVVTFLLVWLLSQSGKGSRNNLANRDASEEAKVTSDDDNTNSPLATLREAAQVLHADAQLLGQVLSDSPPDSFAWPALRGRLASLLARIDELHLIYGAERVATATADMKPVPMAVLLESVIASFREHHAGQGIEISGHIAPALANKHTESTQAVARLVDLLLREAVRHTGHGQLRLNFQLGQGGAMQIEIIGTRADVEADVQPANVVHSLSLSAARSLANAIKGRVDRTSTTSHGPWFSASVPTST